MKKVIVAAASTPARWGELEVNLAGIVKAAEAAANQNAKLLLLPECCLTGADWPTGAKTPAVEDVALELGSQPMREVGRIARRTGLILAVGLYEKLRGRVHITQSLVGPRGLIGAYRKVHEFARSSRERDLFPVCDLGFACVGVMICCDAMFPECARILALRGAELLLVPFTSLPLTRAAWARMRLLALRARAQDNRVFMLSASHAMPHVPGKPSEWGYSGICCAVNPLGDVLAVSKGRVGCPQRLAVALDPADLRTYELADNPAICNRRSAAYRAIVDAALQQRYVRQAPPYRYNDKSNRLTLSHTAAADEIDSDSGNFGQRKKLGAGMSAR